MSRNKDHFDLKELSTKWARGTLTPEESAWLEEWYAGFDDKQIRISDSRHENSEILRNAMLNNIRLELNLGKKNNSAIFTFGRIAVAASVLIFLSFGAYLLFLNKISPSVDNLVKNDIAPGGNKATLTLANGKQINLTDAKNGRLTTESKVTVNKTTDGLVAYQPSDQAKSNTTAYNTLTTPRGGQYTLVLADGTKVILNAASSITYPVAFSGIERRVKLTGEAYFEVAHNKAMPFHVDSREQDVQVLGTHFNINAYDEEPDTKTTLLEGRVKISENSHPENSRTLSPGEQASVNAGKIRLTSVEAEDASAWKDGLFLFDNEPLEHAMLKISRWYDLKVVYENESIRKLKVGGSLSRFEHVSSILHLFEKSGNMHFKISGKTVTITNENTTN